MRLHRLIAILLLIESRETVKAKELAAILETSLRTIHRDIDILCESGIPIKTAPGPAGGISFMDGYSVNMNTLRCDDVISLFLSGIGIHPVGDSEARIALKKTLLKLENSLPREYLPDVRVVKERFYYDPAPWWIEKPPVPSLPVIRKSVLHSKKLKIIYKKFNNEPSGRTVRPYGLVIKAMDWYLIAFCEKSDKIKVFKCERIIDAEVLDEKFTYPENFNLEHFWMDSADEYKRSRREKEIYPVKIRIPIGFSHILEGKDVIEHIKKDDMIYATINLHSYEFSKREALDLIGFAEILEPQELRLYVREKLEWLNALYR